MTPNVPTTWEELSRRAARSVQTTIGWIFWDPGAIARYEKRGLPAGLGYIAARGACFAGAGPKAMTSALGSISPLGIEMLFHMLESNEQWMAFWNDRNEAVLEGLSQFAPSMNDALKEFSEEIWGVAKQLPTAGRAFSASHLDLPAQENEVLHGWHGINYLREWRGDTHWAIVATHGLSGGEASILHNAWLDYDGDWLSLSRGNSPEDIERAWQLLEGKGFALEHRVTKSGIDLRQKIEDETDAATVTPWQLLGWKRSLQFIERFEPPCAQLLERVNITAGPRFQPASRPQGRDRE
jgi:hypothetical protein